MEALFDDLCQDFGGEDVIHPAGRQTLDDWRSKLEELTVAYESLTREALKRAERRRAKAAR